MAEAPPESSTPASSPKMRVEARKGSRRTCLDTKRAASSQSGGVSCEMPLCNKNPSFAYLGEKRRRFCKRHTEPGMVNVYYKYCDMNQCPERATFESNEGKVRRCLAHRESGMVPRSKICRVEGGDCARQSSYGPKGGKPILCAIHKLPGMVQVRTRTCKQPGCSKIPSYGFLCKSRDYCKAHAQEGMVYYSAGSKCQYRGCSTSGTFNHIWARRGSFCTRHKEEGMVDVSRKTCEGTGCIYEAKHGDPEQRTKRFCARHKLKGMLTFEEMGKQMEAASGKAPPAFGSGTARASRKATASGTFIRSQKRGDNPTSQVDSAAVGDSEKLVSIVDNTSPGIAPNDADTVETIASVPGITRRVSPATARTGSNTKEFTGSRKGVPLRRLAPAPGRSELGSGLHPIPPSFAPILGSRANGGGVLFPDLFLPGLIDASPWNLLGAGENMSGAARSAAIGAQPPSSPEQFVSAVNVQRTTSEPSSPVPGPALLLDLAYLAAATATVASIGGAPIAGAEGKSTFSNGVALRNSSGDIGVAPGRRNPGVITVAQAQAQMTSGSDDCTSQGAASLAAPSPEHIIWSEKRAVVSTSCAFRETLLPRFPHPGGLGCEGNDHTKGMDNETFLICLINSMDPADLKSDDLKGAVLSRLRRVRRMVGH